MAVSTMNACVLLDGDLQDPPELITEFVAKWREGYDVVYGRRVKREGPLFMQAAYKIFYRALMRSPMCVSRKMQATSRSWIVRLSMLCSSFRNAICFCEGSGHMRDFGRPASIMSGQSECLAERPTICGRTLAGRKRAFCLSVMFH